MNTVSSVRLGGAEFPVGIDPEASIRSKIRLAYIALALLVVGFGGAAALIPIGGAVVASGSVGVESRVKRIAHPIGGIIAAVYVQNGEHVARGAPLLRLDDKVSGSDASLSALSVDQLLAQRARLEAEQLGLSSVTFPPELAKRRDPVVIRAMANERKMFAIRQREQVGLAAQLSARTIQYQQQIAGFRSQIAASNEQIALIRPEREGISSLYDRGLVTLNRKNQLERQAVDLKGQIASLDTQIAQTEARISETREQLLQLDQTRRSEAGTQLAQINATLNQQQARSISAGDMQSRTLVRAPYAGIVDKLAFTATGDVVKPAETIMEIVPDADNKVIEVMLSPTDIDQIAAGQKARVRFTAYSGPASPEVDGKVVEIAADRTLDPETRRAFFPARVAFNAKQLTRLGGFRAVPGMPAEVFIHTGSRSMLSYITKPLRDQFQRAFRDSGQ